MMTVAFMTDVALEKEKTKKTFFDGVNPNPAFAP